MKKYFLKVSENDNKYMIIIIFLLTSIFFGLQYIFIPELAEYEKVNIRYSLVKHAIFMSIICLISMAIKVFIKSLWVKLCTKNTKVVQLFSGLTYTEIPVLLNNAAILLCPKLIVFSTEQGNIRRLYTKTSLSPVFINWDHTHPMLFKIISFFDLCTITVIILEIIAVSSIAKIPIKRAAVVLMPYWGALLILYFL